MSPKRTVLLVFGAIALSVCIGLIVAGACMLWIESSVVDDEGYLVTKTIRFDNASYAISVEPADINVGPVGVLDGADVVQFAVRPAGEDSSQSALTMLNLVSDEGSEETDMSLVVGARVPWLREVGTGLVAGGSLGLLLGLGAVLASLRGSLGVPEFGGLRETNHPGRLNEFFPA